MVSSSLRLYLTTSSSKFLLLLSIVLRSFSTSNSRLRVQISSKTQLPRVLQKPLYHLFFICRLPPNYAWEPTFATVGLKIVTCISQFIFVELNRVKPYVTDGWESSMPSPNRIPSHIIRLVAASSQGKLSEHLGNVNHLLGP